jgi:hypothetical protein
MIDPQNFKRGLAGCFEDKGAWFELNIDAGFHKKISMSVEYGVESST